LKKAGSYVIPVRCQTNGSLEHAYITGLLTLEHKSLREMPCPATPTPPPIA